MRLFAFLKVALLFFLVTGVSHAEEKSERVVSLGISATEIVFALGSGDKVVAVDQSSLFLPIVKKPYGEDKITALNYYRTLSAEGVLSCNPTLIIGSDGIGPPAAVDQLKQSGVEMVLLPKIKSLEEITGKISQLAETLDQQESGKQLIEQIDVHLKETQKIVSQAQADKKSPPRVIFLMNHGTGAFRAGGTGTAADTIIKAAGGVNVVESFQGYKELSAESALQANPDILLVPDRGLQQLGGLEAFKNLPGLSASAAVQNDRVKVIDMAKTLTLGLNTPEAVKELALYFYQE
ncbi:MAG: ABC transporter substrate-binding protein [Verrucomicrobiota bacterium]